MSRKISLVKSRDQAFKLGTLAEAIDPEEQKNAAFDSFIVSEPGIPAVKVPSGRVLDEIPMIFHRYSNLQGKILINNFSFLSRNFRNAREWTLFCKW